MYREWYVQVIGEADTDRHGVVAAGGVLGQPPSASDHDTRVDLSALIQQGWNYIVGTCRMSLAYLIRADPVSSRSLRRSPRPDDRHGQEECGPYTGLRLGDSMHVVYTVALLRLNTLVSLGVSMRSSKLSNEPETRPYPPFGVAAGGPHECCKGLSFSSGDVSSRRRQDDSASRVSTSC